MCLRIMIEEPLSSLLENVDEKCKPNKLSNLNHQKYELLLKRENQKIVDWKNFMKMFSIM